MKVRIATRGSDLALAQAEQTARSIESQLGHETELVVLKTTGDRIQSVSLAKIGGKGLFVKEIEEALLDGRADVAVHSAKDLPAAIAPGCELAAFPARVDARDALVARQPGMSLMDLPPEARVGTGSVRREALLRRARPDLVIVPLRGNVPTRLQKLEDDDLDAVVLACAGLERLGLAGRISERLDPRWMLPAVCQGILALETREGDPLAPELTALEDADTRIAATAERAFLGGLGGDCSTPMAAWARLEDDRVHLEALLCSLDGSQVYRARHESSRATAEEAGAIAAREVLAHGGQALLDSLREESSK